MIDIVELQKLEVSGPQSAPKNGETACCIATNTHYSSVLTQFN